MGMFDYVIVEYPLPEAVPNWVNKDNLWQTKDTPRQFMETYVITTDRQLIHRSVKYVTVPEEERPYYGKPEWDESELMKLCGMIGSIPTGDIDIKYHGDLHICAMTNSGDGIYEFCNCVVRFNNGVVQYIKIISEDK